MSVNSDASRPIPLCYCGVCARLRYSWISDNPERKWYDCIKYKEAGDCDFFKWADNHMTSYEKRLEEHMRDIEKGRQADIKKVEKMTMANIDRLEKLIETKHKEQHARLQLELGLRQSNRKMFWVAVLVIILGLVIYLSSYSGFEVNYLMLE
ncbi:uncharacterized protein LOC133875325 [Alnus glutinosa]|uniref:uncharacterized protein LOC133875325 n=1 Tax=Alnus glutinosa TaxID=3517 RepID=UPI002D790F58|nr:uncharacterized protein LOC133875325 [Alnus glutinosa]